MGAVVGFLGRFIGPKVLLGALALSSLAMGWLWWSLQAQETEIQKAQQAKREAVSAAKANQRTIDGLRAEIERREALQAAQRREAEARRAKLKARLQEINDALDGDPCADTNVPDGARGVFEPPSSNEDGDRVRNDSEEPDGDD